MEMFWIYLDPCLINYLDGMRFVTGQWEACQTYLEFTAAERALCFRWVELETVAVWLAFQKCVL